jgi:hypothetical protein
MNRVVAPANVNCGIEGGTRGAFLPIRDTHEIVGEKRTV